MNINYEQIQKSVNEYGKYILTCIKNEFAPSLTKEQLQNIEKLLNTEFIIIEKPTEDNIEFFSKQAGITNPNDYDAIYIPSAHGGRTKNDNKIHIYPFTKSFSDCKSNEEIIKSCLDSIIVHEIFHYFIRPNLSLENETIKDEFGHFITEGLVEYYALEFSKKHRLGTPKSNYNKNVEFVKQLIASLPSNLNKTQIDNIIFTYNQDEFLSIAKNGQLMYEEYVANAEFIKIISSLITDICLYMGINKDDKKLKGIINHYKKLDNIDTIYEDLNKTIEMIFKDNIEKRDKYMFKLKTIISDRKLKKEMLRYSNMMKTFLPIEKQLKKLKHQGKSIKEIREILGSDSYILDYVPDVLYHGSTESLDIINSNESTQKGSYVYATDNPIHALFFSIFRNSSIARAHIEEYIDEFGNYKVKYHIDERVKNALKDIITDRNITIHVCNGTQFFKPEGEQYISREWISKDGQSIVPIDKIQVNIKHFFETLEKDGLVEYDRYDKSKDWETVIDLLSQNYPFGLGTEKGKNIKDFDLMYDELIKTNFPEQFEFSLQFRKFIKKVMAQDYKLDNSNIPLEEENNYKLKYIKNIANSFLIAKKDESGKIIWTADIKKINAFLNNNEILEEQSGRKL